MEHSQGLCTVGYLMANFVNLSDAAHAQRTDDFVITQAVAHHDPQRGSGRKLLLRRRSLWHGAGLAFLVGRGLIGMLPRSVGAASLRTKGGNRLLPGCLNRLGK